MNKKNRDLKIYSIRIRELREEQRLTQLQLATLLNTTKQTIWNYESGSREPNIEMLNAIAKYFNVTVDYLIGNSQYKNNIQESFTEIVSKKTGATTDLVNNSQYLFEQYLEIVKLSIYPLQPIDSTNDDKTYPNSTDLIKELGSCTEWLHSYVFKSLEDIYLKQQLIEATAVKNTDLINMYKDTITKDRNNSFYYLKFIGFLDGYIKSLQESYRLHLKKSSKI